MLEKNGHGGDWATAAELYGHMPGQGLDYSANINPLGPPPALQRLLVEEWEAIVRYPDPEVRELRSALAAVHRIAAEAILVGNGAAELIDLIVRSVTPGTVALVEPAFIEYREAAEKCGAEVVPVYTQADNNFVPDISALLDAAARADLLFLGQPNNPTGTRWERSGLHDLLEHAERHGTAVVMDEAFIDFFPDEEDVTLIREAAQRANVFVIRSMTKFYAIPGLRLGYAAAHPARIQELRRLQVPWSVNHFAQKAGVLALRDTDYAERTRRLIATERARLLAELAKLGCRPFHGAANFLLVRLGQGHPDASELQRRLARRGILIRRCATFRGLDDTYFRIAVRTRDENERLIAALSGALEERR
ncbi:threonine-phosphate decarboxylase CobD [Paenibacillus hamazuiensis]|uniref:threonine-phosphate decarboxylase CobD n=1 Tax=Paenibacillus hamazuiensis TaxID=2936508 RepID=UPI00200C18DF|nr:threonine-phosphate decarboxylase CobD [Paenibacillus hamazuiensis]